MDPATILVQTPIFTALSVADVEELLPHLTERSFDVVELKRRWDPENVFSMNQNIPPTG